MKPAHIIDALTMCVLNLGATSVLVTFHVVHGLYGWPNPFVTVVAPLAAAVFLVLTCIWMLELARRARLRPAHNPRLRHREPSVGEHSFLA